MPWFKLDDRVHCHPKTLAAGDEAFGVFCRLGSYASQHGTNGFISDDAAKSITRKQRVLDRLVQVGFLERVDGGYQIHDFLDWNPSAEKVRQERDSARQRMARGRSKPIPVNGGAP
jgi:hypothetical protein